jgi:Fe-S-cluster containining protein
MDIEDLYSLIPSMLCTPGCIECCSKFGVPSRTRVEDERIRSYLKEHGREVGRAQGLTCPYVSRQGCTIYPVRPLTCRMYGSSTNYLCKMGVRPLQVLSEDEEADIFNFYRTYFFE